MPPTMYTHSGDPVYLTADRQRVVAGDDPDAAYLLISAGQSLPWAEAAAYGLTPAGDTADTADAKAAPPPPDKARTASPNKAR